MNRYRVDRNNRNTVPCGMNSIQYIGDNLAEANRRFNLTLTGFDCWGKVNNTYGVILSEWRDGDYRIIETKGLHNL